MTKRHTVASCIASSDCITYSKLSMVNTFKATQNHVSTCLTTYMRVGMVVLYCGYSNGEIHSIPYFNL